MLVDMAYAGPADLGNPRDLTARATSRSMECALRLTYGPQCRAKWFLTVENFCDILEIYQGEVR